MSLMLKWGIEVIVAVALMVVALLAVVPAVAQAKEGSAPASVVVRPGDTLWSISEERLGPQATPQRIAGGAERIYALNRNRIGSNPNLLFAGQKLRLPSAVERRAPEPGSAKHERGAAVPTAPSRPSQAANNGSGKATMAALGDARRESKQSGDARPEAAPLPEPARGTLVPAVRPLTPHDSFSSLAQSVASEARSSFSSVVAVAGEALPRGADSGRKLLGATLIAMSSVLAIILALHVARILWGPLYDERQARERWVREVRSRRTYTNLAPFDDANPYGGPFVTLGRRASERDSQEAVKPAPLEELQQRAISEESGNGSEPSDGLRRHAGFAAMGTSTEAQLRQGRLGRVKHRTVNRRQIVDTGFGELDASQEWEIGEPLRRAAESIPLEPGAARRHALSEVKPVAEDALRTLALLEGRRNLSAKEHRQARALRRFLAALEEEEMEVKAE